MIDAVDGGIINKYNSRATLAYSILFFGLDEVRQCSAGELPKALETPLRRSSPRAPLCFPRATKS